MVEHQLKTSDRTNFGLKIRDIVAAYTLLRIVVGINYFNHGATRIFNIPGFINSMVNTMQDSWIPEFLVRINAALVPPVELIVGALMIIGLFTRGALIACFILMAVLMYGITIIQNWDGASSQLIYNIVLFILLAGLSFNRVSVDAWLRNKRDRIFSNLERAVSCNDWEKRQQLLTFTIVGGGATGVELAGALRELIQATLGEQYPELDRQEIKIILIHSRNRLLSDFPPRLGDYTGKQLRRRGVKIHFQTRVRSVLPGAVELEDDTIIETATIIWTAGVEANLPADSDKLVTAKREQICVRSTLQILDYPEVYAVGDVAYVQQKGKPLLGIAPEALQQGTAVAANLKRQLRRLPPKPFNYFNKGTAAIIARNAGVAYLFGRIPLKGWFAWLLWLGIHLYYLPGFTNRLIVFKSWIKDYFTGDHNIRPIFSKSITNKLPANNIKSQTSSYK